MLDPISQRTRIILQVLLDDISKGLPSLLNQVRMLQEQ